MTDLYSRYRTLGLQEFGDRQQCLDLSVFPEAKVAVGAPAVGLDGGGLCEHQARATERETPQVGPGASRWHSRFAPDTDS